MFAISPFNVKLCAGCFNRVLVEINIRYHARTVFCRIKREATGIGKYVQDGMDSRRQLPGLRAVFPLVKEEAGFLTASDIRFEFQPVFQKDNLSVPCRITGKQHSVLQITAEPGAHGGYLA